MRHKDILRIIAFFLTVVSVISLSARATISWLETCSICRPDSAVRLSSEKNEHAMAGIEV